MDVPAFLSPREVRIAAAVWDACMASIKYSDGTPVEIVHSVNPYRITEED